jgi:NAD(P)-dependent dehydrogenase (short-subunit alcohol dehydrogenase family)
MFGCENIFRVRTSAILPQDKEEQMSASIFDLAGRTALITGGGSGLGQAMAHALSDAGARIILVARREDRLQQALGDRDGDIIALDLASESADEQLRKILDQKQQNPDVIVNAAGVNPRIHADEISASDWQKTVHLNLNIPFLVARQCISHMKSQNWGRIINIGSLQSQRAFENGIAYGAAKGGVIQLTRAMAEAWSPFGINANALMPGFFPTELTAPVFADKDKAKSLACQTAIGRNGKLQDIEGPTLFFASDASAYVTGQALAVDGGFTAK